MSKNTRGQSDQQNELAPPPHSEEMEQATLGAVLINPEMLNDLHFLEPDDFLILSNEYIFAALKALQERGDAIDVRTVSEELRQRGQLDEVGRGKKRGAAYLNYLTTIVPTALNADTYGQLVERMAVRRGLLRAAEKVAEHAYNFDIPTEQAVAGAESAVFDVSDRLSRKDIIPAQAAISDYFDRIEMMRERGTMALGIPTGFEDLDALLGGLHKDDLIIIAGRPGMGKSSWALSVAMSAARIAGAHVGIFSLEMGPEQLAQRMISHETGISTQALRLGEVSDSEWGRFVEGVGRLDTLAIYLDTSATLTPLQLRAKCRRLARRETLDLIIIDYLQLMSAGDALPSRSDRVREVTYISRMLKELARELHVPVLAAAQLNRAVEQRADKRPQLSDLRESGSIENDADIVMFLYRDEVYNDETETPNEAEVIIAKHRNGPTGVINLLFRKSLTRFETLRKTRIDLSELGPVSESFAGWTSPADR